MPIHKKIKGISRVDSKSTHGWFVRAYKNKETYSKLFSDKKYGGKRKALAAAQEHQVKLVKQLKKITPLPRERRLVCRDIRNSTGVLGVCRLEKANTNGEINASYSVTWRPEPGVQKCTSFSVNKYGEKQAFQLAVELRKSKMKTIFGKHIYRQINKRAREFIYG